MRRWSGRALAVVLSLTVAAGCTAGAEKSRPHASPRPARTAAAPAGAPTLDGWSQPTADAVYPERGDPNIDVGAYRLELAWSPERRTLVGTAELTVRAARSTGEARLDLAAGYAVDEVRVDGAGASSRRDGDKLVVALGRSINTGERFSVRIRYRGTPQQAPFPGSRPDVAGIGAQVMPDGGVWAMSEPYGAYTWFPCSDQPSDKALVDVDLTVPSGWAGVSSGRLTATTDAGASRTYRYRQAEPVATYLVAFAVDRFDRIDATGPRGIPVTYWIRPRDRAATESTVRRTPEVLAWLEARLGPYPFGSAGVVIVPSDSGMETQTMVTLGPGIGPQAVPVLAHELTHQWFGDSVTPRTWQDLWLNEGFATYLQMLFSVDRMGASRDAALRQWRSDDAQWRARAGPPGRFDPKYFAARNVYVGPALMLDEVRREIGDDRFAGLLREWPQQHRHSNQDRASFVAWLNGYAGRDLKPVVDKWLDSPTTPA